MNQLSCVFLQSVQKSHGFHVISSLYLIFAQGLQKTHSKWPVSDIQHVWPISEFIEVSEENSSESITLKPWEFWTDCKKNAWKLVQNASLRLFQTTKKQYRFIFFMVRNKRRVEFRTDFHAVYCKSFRILSASELSAHFFYFCPGT